MLVAPTGAGKTCVSAAMIAGAVAKNKRCIFLAHRAELIEQCSQKLDDLQVPHGIIQGNHPRFNPERPVQVASVQTLINREHWPADLIIVDECHRSTSKSYIEVIKRYRNAILVGLSATPYRTDGRGLGSVAFDDQPLYTDLHEVIGTQELIDLGYLIEPEVYGSERPDLSHVDTQMGDYKKDQLCEAMEPLILHGQIVQNWLKQFPNKDACTVIFAPSVKQSIMIVEQFRKEGIAAAHIDGDKKRTPALLRKEILGNLRSRKLQVVSNYGLLTEGYDLPHLECVVLARPTKSRGLFRQMIGRLMRPDPGKKCAIVLDHAGCTWTHGFVTEAEEYTLKGREKRARKGDSDKPVKECVECKRLVPIQTPVCPGCGYEFPKKGIAYTDEELVKLDKASFKKKRQAPKDERQRILEQLCLKCTESGFKPNWAKVRYLHTFGEWPSWNQGVSFPKFFREYEKTYDERLKSQDAAPSTS